MGREAIDTVVERPVSSSLADIRLGSSG